MRELHTIAREIFKTWPKMNYAAKPCADAMLSLTRIEDQYGLDSSKSIVLYFLANAGTWRGEDARRIKKELKEVLGEK